MNMGSEFDINLGDSDFNFEDCSGEQEKPILNDVKSQLKSTFLGGYSKNEVNQLLQQLQTQQEQIQVNLQRQLKELLVERSSLNSECAVLRDQLSETEGNSESIQQMQSQLHEIEGDNQNLSKQLKKSQEQCTLLEQYAQDMENKYNEMKDCQVPNSESELANLMERLQEMQDHCSELEQRLEQKQLENNDMQKRLQNYETQNCDYEELQNQLAVQIDENKKLRALIDQHNSGFEKVKLQFIDLKQKLEDQEKQLSLLESDNELARQSKLALSELQEKYDSLHMECEKVKKIASDLNNRNIHHEADLAQYRQMEQQYKSLTQTVEEQKEQITTLQDKKELTYEVEETLKTLQEKYNLLHNKYVQARTCLSDLNNQKNNLEVTLAKYKQHEQQYIALERENESYQQEMLSMGNTVQDILEQMEIQAGVFKKISEQLEVSQKQLNTGVKEKASLQVSNVDLVGQIRELNNRLSRAEKEKAQLSCLLEKYKAKIQNQLFIENIGFQDNEAEDDTYSLDQNKIGRLSNEQLFSRLAK